MPPHKKRANAPKRKRHVKSTTKRYTKRKTLPRLAIRSAPSAAPNVHMFKRSYDHPFTIGSADSANGVLLNSDSKWMIVQLHTKFNKLPDYTEFKALFSEYKITSVKHRLVPYYKDNITAVQTEISSAYQNAIPNFEIFCLPVNSSAREADLSSKTSDQIDSYINQSQRKGRRLMPSRTQVFWNKNPKVVGYKGPLSKDAGTAMMAMESPTYLNTDPAALVTGGVDQTDVIHYGVTLLIRRVDGVAFPSEAGYARTASMGFRMENDVFFKCRKVQ